MELLLNEEIATWALPFKHIRSLLVGLTLVSPIFLGTGPAKTIALVLRDCLYVSVHLKASPCQGPGRECRDDKHDVLHLTQSQWRGCRREGGGPSVFPQFYE